MRNNKRLTARILSCIMTAVLLSGEAGVIGARAAEVNTEYDVSSAGIEVADSEAEESAEIEPATENSESASSENGLTIGVSEDTEAVESSEGEEYTESTDSTESTESTGNIGGTEGISGTEDIEEPADQADTEASIDEQVQDDLILQETIDEEISDEEIIDDIEENSEDDRAMIIGSEDEGVLTYDELPDRDELFESYFNSISGLNSSNRRSAPRRDRLSGNDRKVYDALQDGIDAIANGKRDTSLVTIPMEYFFDAGDSYTAEDLGVDEDNFILKEEIGEDVITYYLSEDAKSALGKIISNRIAKVKKAQLSDNAYKLFWFDKTSYDTRYSYSWGYNEEVTAITPYYNPEEGDSVGNNRVFTISFAVAKDYQSGNSLKIDDETISEKYVIDKEKIKSVTGAVQTAVKNAKGIVEEAIGHTDPAPYSDYDKIKLYKEKICDLVDYYEVPSGAAKPAYGNIWQVINVFDKDDNTKVVCEGYAKAFKYLIDLTNAQHGFEYDNISADLVSGTVSTATINKDGSGNRSKDVGHMWNIVHMDDGKNYLADITSCDENDKKQAALMDFTFLKGMKGSPDSSYQRIIKGGTIKSATIEYQYDSNTTLLFTPEELTLSNSDYVPVIKANDIVLTDDEITDGELSLYEEEKFTVHAAAMPEDTTDKTITWTSSASEVAEVDEDGEITAVSAGDAVITAMCGKVSKDLLVHVLVRDSLEGALIEFTDARPDGNGTGDNSYIFTGFEIRPEIRVSLDGEILIRDKDFIVKYRDNDPDRVEEYVTAYVAIKGIGKYEGTAEREFEIYANMICADTVEDNCVYTGLPQTPKINLYADMSRNVLLTEGVDYTVKYVNNVKAYTIAEGEAGFSASKAPCAVVTMKGSYSGKKSFYFTIQPVDFAEVLNSDEFRGEKKLVIEVPSVVYNKKKQTPTPSVWYEGKKLKYKTDYFVPEYSDPDMNFITAEDKRITICGKGNYCGEIEAEFKIIDNASAERQQIPMSKVTVSGIAKSYPWTEDEKGICPPATLKYGKTVLSKEDYDIVYYNNKAAGTASAVITGRDNGGGIFYSGTKVITFAVAGRAMSKVKFTGFEAKRVYTGEEQIQNAALSYTRPDKSIAHLVEGRDYTVEYTGNIQKGTASVKYTGIPENGYTGTVKKTFAITAAPAGDVTNKDHSVTKGRFEVMLAGGIGANGCEYRYVKGGVKPEVRVLAAEGSETRLLTEGKDYSIKYTNNTAVADERSKKVPTVTITGKGNYTGKVVKRFAIVPADIDICSVAVNDLITKGSKYYSKAIAVYDGTVKLSSSDYTIVSAVPNSRNTAADITVKGKGSYMGEMTLCCRIFKADNDISKAVITVEKQQYTGNEIRLTSDSQFKNSYIKIGKTRCELVIGKDYAVVPGSYIGNINKGTAKVTIKGINEYTGYKTITFTIGDKSILNAWRGFLDRLDDK